MAGWEPYITWKRLSEVFPEQSGHSLFGSTGLTPNDINQGSIGNCWFMSGASVLAEKPGRIEKLFLNPDTSIN